MNKQKFTQLVRDYHDISAEDRLKLHELVANYPYSQIIHTLVAKANMDANTKIAQQTLGYAAMYASDRGVLKMIIDPKTTRPIKKVDSSTPSKEKQELSSVSASSTMHKGTKITIDEGVMHPQQQSLRDEILKDLQDLKESKAAYLHWLELSDEPESKHDADTKDTKKGDLKSTRKQVSKATQSSGSVSTKKPKVAKKTSTKSKTKTTKSKTAKKKETRVADKKTKPVKEKTKKKEKKTTPVKEDVKKKSGIDQSAIIEDFISKEPSITSQASRKSPTNQVDLSEPSTEFKEDLVSENLAKILISQGKTDKAIDIYKKLIWKFPQKKAYFATQIEELKN